jgi:hypothetical protein
MVTTQWLLPRVSPWASKKLLKVRLKMILSERTMRLTLMLKELRCEGVKFLPWGVFFVKT